jgi:inositol phosphorylceramide mannosyltransferase catalytic subunit
MRIKTYNFSVLFLGVILLVTLTLSVFYGTSSYAHITKGGFSQDDVEDGAIPKIIHQTAPTDKSKWPAIWRKCQQSWRTYFPAPEYEYRMWTDEDIDNLVKTDYPHFYPIYAGYDKNIKRIDIVRYFILYKYGGIYADMDYMCFRNFYDLLPQDKVSISESPFKNNENLQNALMMSPAGHPFWLKVIQNAKDRATKRPKDGKNDVLYQTGPVLISDTYAENKEMVNVLPIPQWNPPKEVQDNPQMITRHYGTFVWQGH